jgi:hypothetical protein
MVAGADMRDSALFDLVAIAVVCMLSAASPIFLSAQSAEQTDSRAKPSVFHIKYVSESSLYIDAGKNADLQDGMKLSVIELPPDGVVNDGIRFRGYLHVAELNLVSVADTSAVCDIISTNSELKIGQLAFLTPNSIEDRHLAENAREAEDYPIMVSFTSGDPIEQEFRSTKVNPELTESPVGTMRARFGFSYGDIREGGMNSSQLGMMYLLEFQRLLAGQLQRQHHFSSRCRQSNPHRSHQSHLPHRFHLRQSLLSKHHWYWPAVSSLGTKPQYHRWRLFR